MADLILRAAAMGAFMGKPSEYYHTSYIVGELNCVPAVDAVPVVHARWIEVDEGDGDYTYDCSVCGGKWWLAADTPEANGMKYCPYCGAKMDGE